MLNILKINKVILIAGLAAAFSLGVFGKDAVADMTDTIDASVVTGQKSTTSKAQQKADEKRKTADKKTAAAKAAIEGAWTKARDERDKTQKDYQSKNEAYNRCLSTGGDCSEQRQAAEEARTKYDAALKAYNQAQKEVSAVANEATKAENKAALAEQEAKKKALTEAQKDERKKEKALKKAQKALEKCKKKGGDCSEEQNDINDAQTALDNAKYKVESAQRKLEGNTSSDSSSGGTAGSTEEYLKNNLGLSDADKEALAGGFDNMDRDAQSRVASQLNNYKAEKESELANAQADCSRYSGMTSQDAQAKAREACANAASLEQELEKINEISSSLNIKPLELDESVEKAKMVQIYYETVDDKKSFTGVAAFSARGQGAGEGKISLASNVSSGSYEYESGMDVLKMITRRAALTILELKQIVYVFAGFGLIAFAWAAIFNKISWKWFANIAMGLFLVANMGRLIEYFAKGETGEYYASAWNDGAVDGNSGDVGIGDVFNDAFVVYGDNPVGKWAAGVRTFQIKAEESGDTENPEEFKASAAGFCKGTSGSGWANFTSCVDDIISTVKKGANAVATAKATIDEVGARADEVANRAKAIADAAKDMKGASLGEIINNTGTILNQATNIVSTTTGAIGSLGAGVGEIANNVQDMGKSVEQQQELENRRISGESTNAVNAAIKGQEWNSNTKGVENVDGNWAGKDTTAKKINDIANTINRETQNMNSSAQQGLSAASTVNNIVNNTSLKDLTLGISKNDTTLADKREEKAREKAAAAVAQAASTSSSSSNGGGINNNGSTNNGNNVPNYRSDEDRDNRDVSTANPDEGSFNKPKFEEGVRDVRDIEDRRETPNLSLPNIGNAQGSNSDKPSGNGKSDEAAKTDENTDPGFGYVPPAEDKPSIGIENPVLDNAKAVLPEEKKRILDRGEILKEDVPTVKAEEEGGAKADRPLGNGKSNEATWTDENTDPGFGYVPSAEEAGVSEKDMADLAAEVKALADDAEKKSSAADDICASNPNSQLCVAAKSAAEMAKEIAGSKQETLGELEKKLAKPEKTVNPKRLYDSGITPEAKIKALEKNYTEGKAKLETAGERLKAKEALEKDIFSAYQKAAQKAVETGLDSDKKIADRLKKNYDLAVSEKQAAATGLNEAQEELKKFDAGYLEEMKVSNEPSFVVQ